MARPSSPTKSRLIVDRTTPTPDPSPRALSGRNCLLGTLADSIFSCVGSISDQEAVLGTESGTVCLLDDREGSQKLLRVAQVGFGITSLSVDSDREVVWLGGRGRKIQSISFDSIRNSSPSSSVSPTRQENCVVGKKDKALTIACMGSFATHLITVEATRKIHIYPMDTLSNEGWQEHSETSMLAHQDPVYGVRHLRVPNTFVARFFSWSRNGTVNFWTSDGKCVYSTSVSLGQSSVDDENANELKVLRAAEDTQWFVSGDRLGVIRYVHSLSYC